MQAVASGSLYEHVKDLGG